MAAARSEPLQAPVDEGQVGEGELEVELVEVAPGVDGARRVRQRGILEARTTWMRASGFPEPGEVLRPAAPRAIGPRRRGLAGPQVRRT